MKRTCLVGATLLLGLAAAGRARAQEPSDSSAAAVVDTAGVAAPDASLAVRRLDYQAAHVEPAGALVLEAFLPEAGYIYAHKWMRGLVPTAATLGGIALMVGASDHTCADGRELCGGASGPFVFMGFTLFLAGRVWGMVGAWHAADSYNEELRTRLRLEAGVRHGRATLGVAIPAR